MTSGLHDLLASTRRVMLSGALTPDAASETVLALMYLDGLSPNPVTLMINSGGGDLRDASSVLDTVDLMRAPVTVDVRGRAHAAAGALVAAVSGRRLIRPSATISLKLHAAPVLTQPASAESVRDAAELAATIRRVFAERVARRSDRDIEWAHRELDSGETRGAQAAVAAGLADSVE